MTTTNTALGFGIIGAGIICDAHAGAIAARPERARLIALADRDERRLRIASTAHFAPFTSTDHRALLDRDDVDVVVIATPPNTHADLVRDALDAGKLVLCEKPLAANLAEADAIVEAARAHPGRVSIVHQQRFRPDVRKLVFLRDQGWLGALRSGTCARFTRFDGTAASGSGWWGRWSVAGGGVAMTQFVHELDLLVHLFGPPASVQAVMDTTDQAIESEDTMAAVVRFESGAIVTCSSTLNAHRFASELTVVGTRAEASLPFGVRASDAGVQRTMRAALDRAFPRTTSWLDEGLPGRIRRKVMRTLGRRVDPRNGHLPYLDAVLDAIADGEPLPVSPSDARHAVDLCAGIYHSALLGERVELPLSSTARFYEGITADDYHGRTSLPFRRAA